MPNAGKRMGVNLTSTAVAARVPNEQARWLRRQAEARGIPVSHYLASLIAEHRREQIAAVGRKSD
jgi:hypothetical protein